MARTLLAGDVTEGEKCFNNVVSISVFLSFHFVTATLTRWARSGITALLFHLSCVSDDGDEALLSFFRRPVLTSPPGGD